MARLPRLFLPGVPSHVIVRGNDRRHVFEKDGDRLAFLDFLRRAARVNRLSVHAYVLMTNHVHLLVTAEDAQSLPRTMQDVGRLYVPLFNRIRRHTGGLWEGRHRSTLVETERYLMACQQYIELNPVRAGMVARPEDFIWSSHQHYRHGKPDDLITAHDCYMSLGRYALERLRAYEDLFATDLPPATVARIRDALHYGWPLGDEAFCDRVEALTGRRSRRLTRPAAPMHEAAVESSNRAEPPAAQSAEATVPGRSPPAAATKESRVAAG
ncbi:MAG TPA: transposase [Usitatibacter sp.]|nr:transposase [Usitatibacter sp.]